MQTRLRKFLEVLRLELEDLEGDLNALVEIYRKRLESHEITNYVYLENKSLLINELHCLANVVESLNEVDATRYGSTQAMIDDVKRMINERAHSCEFPEVLTSLVNRKIAKVRRFVSEPD
jgi:hypothetical protein